MRKLKAIRYVFFVILGVVAWGALFEGLFVTVKYVRGEKSARFHHEEIGRTIVFDDRIGFYYKPNTTINHRFFDLEKPVYDVVYHIDSFGRRRTMQRKGSESRRFFAVMGSSSVFGVGVNDNQVWVQLLADSVPDAEFFNYGVPGGGPQAIPGLIDRIFEQNEISAEKNGYFVYNFMASHQSRIDVNITNAGWIGEYLFYDYGEDGKLTNMGPIKEARSLRQKFFQLLQKSYLVSLLLDFIGHDWTLANRDEATYQKLADLLELTRSRVEEKCSACKFVVLISQTHARLNAGLVSRLEESGFIVLQHKTPDGQNCYFVDGHMTAECNKRMAEAVRPLLQKMQ